MKYVSGLYTDVGIKKKTNQDSLLLHHAETKYGEVVFAVVCDGMGGLQKGEVASAELVNRFSLWFKQSFPVLIAGGALDAEKLRQEWLEILHNCDDDVSRYGSHNGINLGTTMTCILIFGNQYFVANIGDSRVYMLSDNIYQITKDHTEIQDKIDKGLITLDQAQNDPSRNVLLQCIGASDYVKPDFFTGTVAPNVCFMLCCDGFRHVVTPSEFYNYLNASKMVSTEAIEGTLRQITELIKSRGETDNISSIVIRSF